MGDAYEFDNHVVRFVDYIFSITKHLQFAAPRISVWIVYGVSGVIRRGDGGVPFRLPFFTTYEYLVRT